MNAYEIIGNILHEGISQCETSIWERLKLPEFTDIDPRDNFQQFDTAKEFLEYQLNDIIFSDLGLQIDYYALRPLMNEEEFETASEDYKQFGYNYFQYKEFWLKTSEKLKEVDRYRTEINRLFEDDLLDEESFNNLRLSNKTLCELDKIYNYEYKNEGLSPSDQKGNLHYRCYYLIKKNGKGKEMYKRCQRYLEIDDWMGVFLHLDLARLWLNLNKNADERLLKREEIWKLKANYIELFNDYIEVYKEQFRIFNLKQKEHIQDTAIRDRELEELKTGYLKGNSVAIGKYFENVLEVSNYDFDFEKSIEVDFNPENGILIVEYQLPAMENIPKIKEIKYLKSRQEYKNIEVPQRDIAKLFDDACYSVTLRSIYELFRNDTGNFIKAVNFNGWVKTVNKATGIIAQTCILSIQVEREEFMQINLESVDPKLCFKHLKGVGSSKLSGITAIQPILEIKRTDKRFVASQNIEVDNSVNLAIMNWEDFEHLIRELFGKEFQSNGGEVKVTQASRDGGVDAIAFDPDPIRGGKIVIQAKRYSNTVGVSAVRDLYGTVLNEGANKGILVTTSDYGSDSYEFAKGKPLTLLNGSHLLYLLEKHGTHARIDLREAKEILRANN